MEWIADVTAGDWIRERLDHDDVSSPSTSHAWGSTMHGVVPRGFPAYARIFHPARRERPVGVAWPPLPYARHRREWAAFQKAAPEDDTELVSWAEVARSFGATMHPTAQWTRLVGTDPFASYREDGPRDAAGWRYAEPPVGRLEADLVSSVAVHLVAHTATPDAGFVAVWEGWGGLLGFFGHTPSRTFLQIAIDGEPATDAVIDQHNAMLGRSIHDPFNGVFSQPTWQPGILSDDVSNGARLELPARAHVLLRGGVSELADPRWVLNSPWRDREVEAHGFAPDAASPSLVWPDDHAWVFVTEVDYDSTIVGGSAELIRDICADPLLEALPLAEGADLTWTADEVNR